MPLVRIELREGKSAAYKARLGEIVQGALTGVLSVPEDDRFQVIAEHSPKGLIFDASYLGISRTDDCVFVQITLGLGRSVALKEKFYRTLADRLHEGIGLRREDLLINLVEVAKENWSFGNGIAQYVDARWLPGK